MSEKKIHNLNFETTSLNRIFGSLIEKRRESEKDTDYLTQDKNGYEFNSGKGFGNEIVSPNTNPLKQLYLDGADVSGIYDQIENDECSIREKHFSENLILRDNRELTFYYGSNKKDKLIIEGFKNCDYGITLNFLEKDFKTIVEPKTYTPHKIKFTNFDFTNLMIFEVNKEINKHTSVIVQGFIREEDAQRYSDYLSEEDPKIIITYLNDTSKIMFKGYIENYKLKVDTAKNHILEFEAFSYSKKLEKMKMNRIFQNTGTTYDEIFEIIMNASNVGSDENAGYFINFSDSESGSIPLVTKEYPVIFQYKESEWDFLKRICSYLNKTLIVDDTKDNTESINIQAGYFDVDAKKLNNLHGSKRKKSNKIIDYSYYKIDEYLQTEENYNFEMGKIVKYNLNDSNNTTKDLVVIKNNIKLIKNILYSDIVMVEPSELNLIKEKREINIEGRTFRAEVKKVDVTHRALIKFLDIEDEMKETSAYSFPIDRSYEGTYFAPEIGDIVDVYFKSKNEKHATIKSTCTDNNKEIDQNPDIKVIRTAFNKEVKFDQESITITGKDEEFYMKIKEDSIELISGNKSMQMLADVLSIKSNDRIVKLTEENINLVSGNSMVDMQADKMTFVNGDSQVNMADGNLSIQSSSNNIKMSSSGIEIKGKKGIVIMSASKTSLSHGGSKVEVTAAGINLG